MNNNQVAVLSGIFYIFSIGMAFGGAGEPITKAAFIEQAEKDAEAKGEAFNLLRAKFEFFRLDLNNDGTISQREWNQRDKEVPEFDRDDFIQKFVKNRSTLFYCRKPNEMFEAVDFDGNGKVSHTEMAFYKHMQLGEI